MISKWRWILLQLTHRLWVRASLFAAIGVITALAGVTAERFLPAGVPNIGADSVGAVLNILASSMLTVTTFSLGTMVSAYSAATSNVTPRATRLLIADSISQTALSTFLGSFLFSLVGIITLTIEGYGQRGRLVLFVVTVGVVLVIVVTMLRWIEHLTKLGRVSETSARVEEVASKAIAERRKAPALGGRPRTGEVQPEEGRAITSRKTGYVQHVDMAALQSIAEDADGEIFLDVLPGSFVHRGMVLGQLTGSGSDDKCTAAAHAVSIDDERTFEQDPRFGVLVLAEIASRALSAAMNDSGTAIDVIGRLVRVLLQWADGDADEVIAEKANKDAPDGNDDNPPPEVHFNRVWVHTIADLDLVEDAFVTLARDGAARLEVQVRLQKALGVLSAVRNPGMAEAAREISARALAESDAALDRPDRMRLTDALRR